MEAGSTEAADAGEFEMEREDMRAKTPFALAAAALLILTGAPLLAQAPQQTTFPSADAAAKALAQATKAHDEQTLNAIFGGNDVASVGDPKQDRLEQDRFAQKYGEMHRLVKEPDGTTVLYIGAENWPFPIPLVSKDGRWRFDSDTGKQEILFRRIGENEAMAVEVCRAFGSRSVTDAANEPYYGYYFRIVPEGKDHSSARVALVAYPAEYRSSGVMTFVLTQGGDVYQKDLGPDTKQVASAMTDRRPGGGWHRVPPSAPAPHTTQRASRQ
jgi:Protein of unknown function (DUF2950)